VTPVSQRYRDIELHEIPPNGQGLAALMALGLLDRFELGALDPDGAEAAHLQIEAVKLAFADVYAHVAEPSAMRVRVEDLLAPAYLDERARAIDPRRARDPGPGLPPPGGTIFLTTADAQGRMVSFIQSNYMGFGSGVVLPGWGISLQNRGHGFSLDPGHPNVVAPRKRPFHTIIPAFVTRGGQPLMSYGVMGAHMQPQGHVQTLVRMVDFAQSPQAACDAPRWRVDGGLDLGVEAHMASGVVAGLASRGHRMASLNDSYQDFGAGQFIWRLGEPGSDGYVAASDPRRDGAAVGF
jgi:gamma-glutamyltranspeptidase/glutathione hydrolase